MAEDGVRKRSKRGGTRNIRKCCRGENRAKMVRDKTREMSKDSTGGHRRNGQRRLERAPQKGEKMAKEVHRKFVKLVEEGTNNVVKMVREGPRKRSKNGQGMTGSQLRLEVPF